MHPFDRFDIPSKAPMSLVEVKLVSCGSITSEAVCELAMCSSLEVLHLHGYTSIADSCLSNILCLRLLTYLKLSGTDVINSGMAFLGEGGAPISCLSLRGCKKVTDKGILYLLGSEGKISKTLSSLDLSDMPGISDNAITTSADVYIGLTQLCIRNCSHVTNASVKALALKGNKAGSKLLCQLDLFYCTELSTESFELLKNPLFRDLQWIGTGQTGLLCGNYGLTEIYKERPWLTICNNGCEVGCQDGWQFRNC